MKILTIVLTVLSSLLLAAHYLRAGLLPLLLLALLVLPFLAARGMWRRIPLLLFFGWAIITWGLTTAVIVHQHVAMGIPYVRAMIILGSVTLVTIVTAILALKYLDH